MRHIYDERKVVNVIDIPVSMPRLKGHRKQKIGAFILRLMGWKLAGKLPNEPKLIVAGAPHTSNWDFLFALAVILNLGVKASILMKKEAFVWPFSRLWRWFGFIPTNRQAASGIVGSAVEHFENNASLWLAVTPEGTRSQNSKWKTGFLRIAYQADVPILLMSLDYTTKTWRFGKVVRATGDHEKDLLEIRNYFSAFTGKHPHRQG